MKKLEAFIFIAVLLVAIGGLFYLYQGTGQAVRRLPACSGGYIIPYMSFSGLAPNYIEEFKFRGIEGVIELVDIKEEKAMFKVNGVMTPYLGLTESWIGETVGVKVGNIDSRSVGVCLASSVPECVDYYWDLNSRQRECGNWQSQTDYMF